MSSNTKNNVMVPYEEAKPLAITDMNFLAQTIQKFLNALMLLEAENLTGAGRYERAETRENYLNGKRVRPYKTGVGEIGLEIPKLRAGTYFPGFLEPRKMMDKALENVIQEAYINGVSTAKIDKLFKDMGVKVDKSQVSILSKQLDEDIESFRKRPLNEIYQYIFLDAMFPKVREAHKVQSMAFMLAIGVKADGHREVLGFDISMSEDGANWEEFLKTLVLRGLKGVKLITSDAHPGLKQAIFKTFPGVQWQRCEVHFMRNVLAQVSKGNKEYVAAKIRPVFNCSNREEAEEELKKISEDLKARFPKVSEMLDNSKDEVLAFYDFPDEHRKQIYTSNCIERLNRELDRRFNVVSVFPNRDSVIRLGGSVLIDIHDEWIIGKPYLQKKSNS